LWLLILFLALKGFSRALENFYRMCLLCGVWFVGFVFMSQTDGAAAYWPRDSY
jgi:hypothetical protein